MCAPDFAWGIVLANDYFEKRVRISAEYKTHQCVVDSAFAVALASVLLDRARSPGLQQAFLGVLSCIL